MNTIFGWFMKKLGLNRETYFRTYQANRDSNGKHQDPPHCFILLGFLFTEEMFYY